MGGCPSENCKIPILGVGDYIVLYYIKSYYTILSGGSGGVPPMEKCKISILGVVIDCIILYYNVLYHTIPSGVPWKILLLGVVKYTVLYYTILCYTILNQRRPRALVRPSVGLGGGRPLENCKI